MSTARTITFRMIVMLIAVGLVLGGVFGWGYVRGIFIAKFLAGFGNQTQTVAAITAEATPWQASLNSVGSLTAVNGADLSAEVPGIVDSIRFESGADVPAGAVLLTLRPNADPAVLAQLQAQVALDQVNYNRDRKQFAADAIAQSQVDTDRANLAVAQAQAAAQQATMAEKMVRAPFAGRLGIRKVDIGQYLTAGTQIVTLQQLDPLFVDFYLPQQALSQISVGQTVQVGVDAFPGRLITGKISALSAVVDSATRNIEVRATVPNQALDLRPGMFATVSIAAGPARSLVTLPLTAITYNPYGDTVFLARRGADANGHAQLTAQQVFVTLGDTRGDQVAVLQGVRPGDTVVTAGQLKLRNGATLVINNVVQPPNNPNPNLPNE